MTVLDTNTTTPADALRAAVALGPVIAARAPEVEAARRVPPDLLQELVAAGLFGVLLPTTHGGAGADLAQAMRVFEAVARADASVGWTVTIGASGWCDLAGLPRATFDDLFGEPGAIVAGAFNPSGSITPDAGGYRVNGRWGFASGCEHARWVFGNCIEGVVDGAPQLRLAVFSPEEVVIEDTWRVSGLCGTGSHHFRADDVVVSAHRTFPTLAEERCLDEPIVRVPAPALISLAIASVAIGTARGALEDVIALAEHKVPLFAGAPLGANPLFQAELANADTELRAARALLYESAGEVWAAAVEAVPLSLEQRGAARAAAAWATARAAAVVDTAYRSGGGSSIYAECPLQRRFRDVHAITQHFLVKPDTLTTAGAILARQDVDVLVF